MTSRGTTQLVGPLFLLDRLGRCIKLIVSSRGTSCHEFAPQFGLACMYKAQTTVARPAAVDHRSAVDKQLNWNGHNPFSWVAQRQELSAKTLLRSAAITVQTPCREKYCFHFYCLRLTRLTFNPRNIISNIIMIFNINSTRGQTRFNTCVDTCLVYYNSP